MTALYQQVSDSILEKIQGGVLQVGNRLPPEAEYAAELGISRSTLRLAFAELERAGILQRKKRAGTVIVSDKPRPRFIMNTTGIYELLSLGRDTDLSSITTRTVSTAEIPLLEGLQSTNDSWLEVSGSRMLPDEVTPFNVNRVYVPNRFIGIEPLLKERETSVFRVIEDTFNLSVGRVTQVAKSISCPQYEANIMGLPSDSPVLQIDAQLFARDNSLMEVSTAIFDPNRFQVRTDISIGQ